MEILEKLAVSEESDKRGIPPIGEFFPLIGLYIARRDENNGRRNIMDCATVKPFYFLSGWVIHVLSLTLTLSYIASSLGNYFNR